jgi:tRNA (guanine-N7-)-methyltransferase
VRHPRRLSLEELQPYLLELPPPPREPAAVTETKPLSWPEVFGNDHAVELEVGFGKGLFLLTAAQACPDVNFLGIEIERKYALFSANRVAKRGLRNLRLVWGDARLLLRARVSADSLQAIHVYFPDPWWKTRHRKRRLFTGDFARECQRTLLPGGHLYVATDVADYFAVMSDLLARETKLTPVPAVQIISEPRYDLDYLTNFERKYRLEGRPIYRAVYAKL